jgi:hypothetical protein
MMNLTVIEKEGVESFLKKWSGLDVKLIVGGPSLSDPMGLCDGYISFRDSRKTAVSVGFDGFGINKLYQSGVKGE